jgi:hypothetical protein
MDSDKINYLENKINYLENEKVSLKNGINKYKGIKQPLPTIEFEYYLSKCCCPHY